MNREPLDIATLALRVSELALARGRPRKRYLQAPGKVWSEVTIPVELVMAAATPSAAAFASWLLFVLVAAALSYWVVMPLGWFEPQSINGYFYAMCFIAALCLVLGRPSTLGFPDVNGSALSAARMWWPESGELSDSERAAAQFLVNIAASATQRRVVALWWVTGATWALFAYLLQKGFEAKDGNLLSYALAPALVSLSIGGLTAAYARSVNHVHALALALLLPPHRAARIRRTGRVRSRRQSSPCESQVSAAS